jgi:hypothetical protein
MNAKRFGVAAGLAAALAAAPAAALKYSGYLGTTVYGYNAVEEPAANHYDTYVPVRFQLNQDTGGGNFGLVASSRLYQDLAAQGDVNGRVYYGYLRWRAPGDALQVELGRQYIAAGVTAATLDGAHVLFKRGKKWRAEAYGGSSVTPDYGPMRRLSREETFEPEDRGYWLDSYTYGAHGGANVKELWEGMMFPIWLGGGGSISKRNGHVSDTTLGAEAVEDLRANLKTSQEVRFDFLGRRVDYQYYSARYRPVKPLGTYLDYRWLEPRFDYTSIFSVFAREARHRLRVGGQYKVSEILQPFADYAAGMRRDNVSHRLRAGVEQNFDYAFVRYGASYGLATRGLPGGDELGAFAGAEFPRPIPSFEPFSAGASLDYVRYKGYAEPAPEWEDVLLGDLHGRLQIWRFLETTLGAEALTNPDRTYEIRAYVEASASISG